MASLRRLILVLTVLLAAIGLVGCWDNRDFSEIAFLIAIGLDSAPNDEIEVTMQIIKPSAIKSEEQGGNPGKTDAVWVISSTGKTAFEAIRSALATIDRKAFFAHTQLVIVGEDLARDGIADLLDLFIRDPEPNKRADMLIAKGTTARRIMEARSELEVVPTMHITEILENNKYYGKIRRLNLYDLYLQLGSPGRSPAVGVIEVINEREQLQVRDTRVEGAAVFKGDRLVGWLTPDETRGLLFIEGDVQGGILSVTNPLDGQKAVAIEMKRSSVKKDIRFNDGYPSLYVEVDGEGSLGSQHGAGDLTTPEMISTLQQQAAAIIEHEIRGAIGKAQHRYETDIFGFGDIAYRKYPDYWRNVKTGWDQEFASLGLTVDVNYIIKKSGLMKKPLVLRQGG
jgi:spore germination protein KC